MNIKMIGIAALLAPCFVCLSFAQVQPDPQSTVKRQSIAAEKSAAMQAIVASATPKSSVIAAFATGNSEVFRNIYIGMGKSVSLDSKLDYSSAGTVAIGLQCIICDTSATSLGTSGLVLQAQWAVPDAGLFVTTENSGSNTFVYWDSGGVIFSVYGSQFRLTLQNKGKQPIAIEQITLLSRSN